MQKKKTENNNQANAVKFEIKKKNGAKQINIGYKLNKVMIIY